MKCPVCTNASLSKTDIEPGLRGLRCPTCRGIWIAFKDYERWLVSLDQPLPEKSDAPAADLTQQDSPAGKFCPECNTFLRREKVGHGLDFHLDRCFQCGGIWFDGNEWDILKSRNLHDEAHLVFMPEWQREVRLTERRESLRAHFQKTLGDENYREIMRIKKFLRSVRPQSEAKALLENELDD